MIIAVVIMSVFVAVCMAAAIKVNNSGEAKTAVVLMCAGLVMLVCTVSFVLSSPCRLYIKAGLFGKTEYGISSGENDFSLPLPEGCVKESGKEENVFVTNASFKQIEGFYSKLVGEENCVIIKTGDAERISLKFNEMYFLIKVTAPDKDMRRLEITISE